MHTKTYTTYNG